MFSSQIIGTKSRGIISRQIILSLIILIAAFNVVTSLFILVKNKTKEIAIMRTIGISRSGIMRIFLLIGSILDTYEITDIRKGKESYLLYGRKLL